MQKTLNIKDFLEKRIKTPLRMKFQCDLWLQEIAESSNEYEYFIETISFGTSKEDKENREKILKKYYFFAIIDLSNFLPLTGIKMNFYIFSKKKPSKIKIGIYKDTIKLIDYKGNSLKKPILELPKSYPQKYELYLQEVENFINNNVMPKDTNYYEFNEIEYDNLDIDNLTPNRYSKDYFKLQEFLKNEKLITLKECADIIKPKIYHNNKDEKGHTIKVCDFQYPLDEHKLAIGARTDTILKQGDILVKPFNGLNVYLIAEKPKSNIYAGLNDFVIRSKNEKYSPEYLYLYFKSKTYKDIIRLSAKGTAIQRISMKDLLETKVIIPQKEQEYYKQLFKLEINKIKEFDVIQRLVVEQYIEKEKLEDILDAELISKATITKNETLNKILETDLNEINVCYKAKAYKATLILCGSVLEAFILDWLNELQPEENWLEKTYYINKKGDRCSAGLDYYISKIAKISTPPWIKQTKDSANLIKDKRNLVHAKLCLRDDVEINNKICKEVISYLKDIINKR